MARLIISEQKEESLSDFEKEVCSFLMRELPDYIFVFWEPEIKNRRVKIDLDLLLLVPHMGIYVIKLLDASKRLQAVGSNSRLHIEDIVSKEDTSEARSNRKFVKKYMRDKFNITPLVYDMIWIPNISLDDSKKVISDSYFSERILLKEDMKNFMRFLLKLQIAKVRMYEFYPPVWGQKYDDLTDTMAHNIFYYWKSGMPNPTRPEKPPLVFLSYNQMNQLVAGEIKANLEHRGIFVWRAPEDVPISADYIKVETDAIEQSDAFLILLSSSSQESEEVRYEFETAVQKNKMIIPIWIEKCEINRYFQKALAKYQYRIMLNPDSQILDEVESVIRKQKN